MNKLSGRLLGWLVVLAVALGTAGCGGGDDSGSSRSEAKQASQALDEGLKAQADGDLTTASEKYAETLKLDPDNKFAYYNLALIDEARSNYGLAEAKYRKALEADPAYEPALFNLAILRTSSDPEEATSLYRRAIKANPKDASAHLNLGLLLRASGEKAEGDRLVERAVELDPKLVDPATTGG